MEESSTLSTGDQLHDEIALLKEENANLRFNLERLEREVQVGESLRAESVIARLAGGRLSSNNADHDVYLSRQKMQLEVKFSRINVADKRHKNPTARWAWHKIFGSSGQKKFDRLILIGERDDRYAAFYATSGHPLVVFDIPYAEASSFTIKTSTLMHEMRSIQLVTNPNSTASAASQIFTLYQTTLENIETTYGGKCEVIL